MTGRPELSQRVQAIAIAAIVGLLTLLLITAVLAVAVMGIAEVAGVLVLSVLTGVPLAVIGAALALAFTQLVRRARRPSVHSAVGWCCGVVAVPALFFRDGPFENVVISIVVAAVSGASYAVAVHRLQKR